MLSNEFLWFYEFQRIAISFDWQSEENHEDRYKFAFLVSSFELQKYGPLLLRATLPDLLSGD